MIQIVAVNAYHFVTLLKRRARDGVEHLFIKRRFNLCVGRAKVCEVAVELFILIGDERARIQRRVWRDEHDRLRTALDNARRQFPHRFD